jgi:hypothetical protein
VIGVLVRRPRSKVSRLQGVKALSGAIKYAIACAYPINTLQFSRARLNRGFLAMIGFKPPTLTLFAFYLLYIIYTIIDPLNEFVEEDSKVEGEFSIIKWSSYAPAIGCLSLLNINSCTFNSPTKPNNYLNQKP